MLHARFIEEPRSAMGGAYSTLLRKQPTYQVASSKQEMTKLPKNFENFIELLKNRHTTLMSGRPDKEPVLLIQT